MAASQAPEDDPRERELAGALHEVANALTVVLGWLESARPRGEGDAPHDPSHPVEVAYARARVARLIARRAIGDEVDGDDLPRLLGEVIREALVGLEPEAARAGVHMLQRVDAADAAALLPAGDRVVQILTNLLLNAIAMSPRGGEITVSGAVDEGGRALLVVADDGPGVAPSRRGSIFAGGFTTRPGGAGIGLRHSHQLAAEQGGSLRLVDCARGARFELTWPTGESEPAPATARPVSSRIPLMGIRILVVEDDEAVIDLLDTALSARGAQVHAIRRSADLDTALASGHFDAALLDISPISEDVSGALARVREGNPEARIVMISGSAISMPPLPDGSRAEWVRKPFEVAEIVDAVLREG